MGLPFHVLSQSLNPTRSTQSNKLLKLQSSTRRLSPFNNPLYTPLSNNMCKPMLPQLLPSPLPQPPLSDTPELPDTDSLTEPSPALPDTDSLVEPSPVPDSGLLTNKSTIQATKTPFFQE